MIVFSKPDVEQFFRTLTVQDFAVSPNESQLIFSTNLNGNFNLWGIDLPRTFPYPLTFIDQTNHGIHYDKQGRFVAVVFDRDGDENTQIYAVPREGGQLKPLRTKEGERHFFGALSDDGKRLYYTTTRDNPVHLNTYRYDLETDEETLIFKGEEGANSFIELAPDESSWISSTHLANTFMPAYVHKGDDVILLTPSLEPQHTVLDAAYTSPDDIYFVTDYGEDYAYLAHFRISTRTFNKVFELDKEGLFGLKYDKQHEQLLIMTNKGVEDRLYRYDLQTEKSSEIPVPVDTISKLVVADSGNLYLLGDTATRPLNIYVKYSGGETWQTLTDYRVPGVAEEDMVEPEVIHYPSYDGLEIEGLFFRAKEEVANGHVIHWPHGGPQAAETKGFRALFQLFLYRGYSVFAPNFRGSTGYGLKYTKMIEGDWGYGPRLDNIKGLDWLIDNGYVDRDKIFLVGGSYGGYMALLLHAKHADYYKAVIDIFGPSNLFSFIDSVPDHWKPAMKQWVGDPVEDKEKLTEDSPISHLDGMTRPMFVIQGANDPRVVKAESDQIVEALREKGREVEYLVMEDEGHGFSKKKNEIDVYRKCLAFLDRHL